VGFLGGCTQKNPTGCLNPDLDACLRLTLMRVVWQQSELSRRPSCFLPNFPVNMLPMYVAPPPTMVGGPPVAFTRSAVSASAVLSRRHHSGGGGGGGRVDHTPTRKVITVSLQQAVQLHTSDNAWKPATLKPAASSTADSAEIFATQVTT